MSRLYLSILRITSLSLGTALILSGCSELKNLRLPSVDGSDPDDECQAHIDASEWSAAIDCYTKKIAENPGEAKNWTWRAYTYAYASNNRKAISDATKALELDPKSDQALEVRANSYRNLKMYKQSIADYTAEIALTPEGADTYVSRGDCYDDMKEYEKALADYNKAVALDKDKTSSAINNRGWLYLEEGKYEKAIVDFDASLDANETDTVAGYNRAAANFHGGHADAALGDLKSVLEHDPSETRAFLLRGVIALAKNEPKKALEEFDLASDRSTDPPTVMFGQIYSYLTYKLTGKNDDAQKVLKSALEDVQSSEWPYPILLYLSGKITEKTLFDFCTSDDERTECRGVIAFNAQLSGDTKKAHENFVWIKEHSSPNNKETFLARQALKDAKFLTVASAKQSAAK